MKQRQRYQRQGTPQRINKALTHIRLLEVNPGNLAALDALAPVYLALCQQYVTLFCTEEFPDKFHAPFFSAPLSERWHRVAIQQAAGIAQAWRTNRAQAYQDYLDDLLDYHEQQVEGTLEEGMQEPISEEWDVPTVRQTCIQANANVVILEPSHDSTFDYWLKISTLELRKVLLVPVKLAAYHKEQLTDPKTGRVKKLNSTSSKSGQRLARHVRQEINRAVNQCFTEHEGCQFAYEHLSVATMKHKARVMNAYLRASNLAHIPGQIEWNAAKRGVQATRVKSAYSSQECSRCHYPDRANRPDQQTFCCVVCRFQTHADLNAATNLARRVGDLDLQACKDRQAVKSLLMQRHAAWGKQHGWP